MAGTGRAALSGLLARNITCFGHVIRLKLAQTASSSINLLTNVVAGVQRAIFAEPVEAQREEKQERHESIEMEEIRRGIC